MVKTTDLKNEAKPLFTAETRRRRERLYRTRLLGTMINPNGQIVIKIGASYLKTSEPKTDPGFLMPGAVIYRIRAV